MKRNKFKRALHHLNKKNVVESAPTNSTLGVFNVTPSGVGPVGWTDRTFTTDISGNPLPKLPVADFTVGENPSNATEAQDTSGLFEDDGTIKTLTPPGDNSYILGPFSSMWYAWGNFTTLGYIRQADRKMVNLGTITGKLSDWDGSSINSYGQLTLEQALWFKDVKKFGDIDNDPANHNYRAFYPGPPSNTPDANGRYRCVIAASREAGGEETRPAPPINPTQPGEMSPEDNFAAIMDKISKGLKLSKAEEDFLRSQGLDDFVDGGKTGSPLGELALLGMSLAAAKAMIYTFGAMGPAFAKMMANEWSKRTLSDAAYKTFLQTGKMPPGIQGWRPFKAFTLKMLKTGPTAGARRALEALFYGIISKFSASDKKKYEKEINEYKDKLGIKKDPVSPPSTNKWQSRTEFMKNNPNTSMQEYLSSLPYGATNFMKPDPNFPGARIVDTAAYERYFMTGDTTGVSGKPRNPDIQTNKNNKDDKPIDPFKDEIKPNLDAKDGDELASAPNMDLYNWMNKTYGLPAAEWKLKNPNLPDSSNPHLPGGAYVPKAELNQNSDVEIAANYNDFVDPWDKILKDIDKAGENLKNNPKPGDPDYVPPGRGMGDRWKVKKQNKNNYVPMVASYQKSGRVLSESRKHLIREIKKPTTLPEAKKKFKVKPKVLGHPSNSTLSNQMKDTTPNVAFKKEIPVWSMDQKIRNARSSQEKKNEVLEYLGSSGDHWNYMTKTIKEHNKKIINLNYGGKKKVTRKEQVDKDTLVFMEDEDGSKSNMLQSKINEMQAESGDKEMFAKYYEMNPTKKSLFKEVVKRGVFDYPKKPSRKGYPDKEPAKLDPNTGMHPEYGKKYKHDKLDPHSAESMPMQGDPEIDANISKNVDQEKKKRKSKILSQPNG